MTTPNEEILFQSGIAALQAGNNREAQAIFQSIVDQNLATAKSWLGLALSHLLSHDTDAAEPALDKVLELEPQNIRAHIFKGDIHWEREEYRPAAGHYSAVMTLSNRIPDARGAMLKDLNRVAQRHEYLGTYFTEALMKHLRGAGYQRASASPRFNQGLDMLMGTLLRGDETRRYPQTPHVFYLPGLPYHTFYPETELPWLAKLEAHTDIITDELKGLMAQQAEQFSPYVHKDLARGASDDAGLRDSETWTSAFLWEDGKPVHATMEACPQTTALLEKLPICSIKDLLPTVLFSKLSPGATIAPHTGMLNARLICHLPLVVPEDCGLRVGEDTRMTERGKAWAFDDSVNHEAWNRSDQDRVILLFDVWRPELDESERHLITALLEAVNA